MNYDLFHSLVDQLVLLNTGLRRGIPEGVRETMSPARWAFDFGTVHANIGRRSGKTEYILRRATANDLVVVFNAGVRRVVFPRVPCPVLTMEEIRSGKARTLQPEVVFVDEPSLVFQQMPRADLYRNLVHGPSQTFILLGE